MCDEHGEKLSKRQRAESITELREAGAVPEEIIGRAMHAAGLVPEYRPMELAEALALVGD